MKPIKKTKEMQILKQGKKNRLPVVFFSCFCRSPSARKGRREEAIPDPPCPLVSLAATAARGEDVPPLFT